MSLNVSDGQIGIELVGWEHPSSDGPIQAQMDLNEVQDRSGDNRGRGWTDVRF